MRLARGSGVDGLSGMAAGEPRPRGMRLAPAAARGAPRGAAPLARGGRAWPGPRIRATPTRASTGCGRGRRCRGSPRSASAPSGWRRRRGRWRGRARRWSGRRPTLARRLRRGGRRPAICLLDPAPLAAAPEELRLRLLAGGARLGVGRGLPAAARAARGGAGGGRGGAGRARPDAARLRAARPRRPHRDPARAGAVAPAVPLAAGRWDGRWQIDGTPPAGDGPDDRRARCRAAWRGSARIAAGTRRARRW